MRFILDDAGKKLTITGHKPAEWRTNSFAKLQDQCDRLNTLFEHSEPDEILAHCWEEFGAKVALVASFGTESALLLRRVAAIDPQFPVIFLNTQRLFPETLQYKDQLTKLFKLTNVVEVLPNADHVKADDPDQALYKADPDYCCHIRKTLPLIKALQPFDAWITGRKRAHGADRATLPLAEAQDGRIKINPLASWPPDRIEQDFVRSNTPQHPLKSQGYLSVGCECCTAPCSDEGNARSGRWAGSEKTECGIHFGEGGISRR